MSYIQLEKTPENTIFLKCKSFSETVLPTSPPGSCLFSINLYYFSGIVSKWCMERFGTKIFKSKFIYILYTFFSCCTFKSHALLETALSAFILNHVTKDEKKKKKKKKSIQYSGSMLHSFNFGISNMISL